MTYKVIFHPFKNAYLQAFNTTNDTAEWTVNVDHCYRFTNEQEFIMALEVAAHDKSILEIKTIKNVATMNYTAFITVWNSIEPVTWFTKEVQTDDLQTYTQYLQSLFLNKITVEYEKKPAS